MLVELHKEDKIRGTFYLALLSQKATILRGKDWNYPGILCKSQERRHNCLFHKKIGECLRRHSHDLQK